MGKISRGLMSIARVMDKLTRWVPDGGCRSKLARFVTTVVSGRMSDREKRAIVASLRGDIVARKVESLARVGCDSPDIYILCVESIGDVIACEPISRYLRTLAPKSHITWIVRAGFEELVAFNPAIDTVLPVSSLGAGEDFCATKALTPNTVVVNCHLDGWRCMRTNRTFSNPTNPRINLDTYLFITGILGAYSAAAGLPMLDESPIFHLDPNLAEHAIFKVKPYVVFHCHSTDISKNWRSRLWNCLAESLMASGCRVVEIGSLKIVNSSSPLYIDLSGNRCFQEIAQIVKEAAVYVGIDSGFAHMANCFRIPSVILQGHYRNYKSYDPYSGTFSRSDMFRIVRAPKGRAAECVVFDDVLSAVEALRSKS